MNNPAFSYGAGAALGIGAVSPGLGWIPLSTIKVGAVFDSRLSSWHGMQLRLAYDAAPAGFAFSEERT